MWESTDEYPRAQWLMYGSLFITWFSVSSSEELQPTYTVKLCNNEEMTKLTPYSCQACPADIQGRDKHKSSSRSVGENQSRQQLRWDSMNGLHIKVQRALLLWDFCWNRELSCLGEAAAGMSEDVGTQWAILVAGAKDWSNYGLQVWQGDTLSTLQSFLLSVPFLL